MNQLLLKLIDTINALIHDMPLVRDAALIRDGALVHATANDTTGRPVAAAYEHQPAGAPAATSTIRFNYLVKASGHVGLMSQHYLKNHKFNMSLNNVTCWDYWVGCQRYEPGMHHENAVWIEAQQGACCPHSTCVWLG